MKVILSKEDNLKIADLTVQKPQFEIIARREAPTFLEIVITYICSFIDYPSGFVYNGMPLTNLCTEYSNFLLSAANHEDDLRCSSPHLIVLGSVICENCKR